MIVGNAVEAPAHGKTNLLHWLKRFLIVGFGVFWLALAISDYAILSGRNTLSMGNLADSYDVRCSYWTGWGRHREWHRGIPNGQKFDCLNVIEIEKDA